MNPVNPPCWTFRGTRKIVIHNCCSESVTTSTRKYPKHWFTTWVAKHISPWLAFYHEHQTQAAVLWQSDTAVACSFWFLFDRLIFPESIFRWHSSYVFPPPEVQIGLKARIELSFGHLSSLKSIKNTSHVKGSQPETANTNWSNLSGCRFRFTWIRNCWKDNGFLAGDLSNNSFWQPSQSIGCGLGNFGLFQTS